MEGLLKIGVLFGQKGVHDVAEILIMQGMSNKGVALGNLGKYDEAIKCYDEDW